MLLKVLVLVSLALSQVSASCSSGDTVFMCTNLNTCWMELGFQSKADLQYLCEIQGYTYDPEDPGAGGADMVIITTPPRNLTVPPGAAAAFRCSADNALKIVIVKTTEMGRRNLQADPSAAAPTQQTTIQEIDSAMYEHEGWYTCTAYGVEGTSVSSEAYLKILDVCANSYCEAPKVCQADKYTGTYECVCPGECAMTFDPVCGSDCASYFNECTLRKETCEKGLIGVTVASRGLCSFTPTGPQMLNSPSDMEYERGARMSLTASANGSPAPSYTWYVGGVQVGQGDSFSEDMRADYEGQWTVKAANCHGTLETSASFYISMAAGGGTLTPPSDQCCKVYGDPHILTFDGKAYDYMGIGTFVIAQQAEGIWVVYGTFEACGDRAKQLSCVTSVTVFYEYSQVQLLRMWRVNNNGNEFMVPVGQTRSIGNIRLENRNLEYIVTLGDTGVVIRWDGIVTSQVCVSKCAGNVGGLCGNGNCNPDDEWLGMGFMDPYTGSWLAQTSSQFGNSWAIDPDNAILEPQDGSLPVYRTRPCDVVPYEIRMAVEDRCNQISALSAFALISGTNLDLQVLLKNCYFDGCAGLMFGAGCKDNGNVACPVEIEALIAAAMATGMTRGEAVAMYGGRGLDTGCLMGLGMQRELDRWGVYIGAGWRTQVTPPCPSDEEIGRMKICPT